MAYAESTIGGSMGGSFRVFVNSIRSYNGSAAENYENWYCNGGVNRVSTSGGHTWHYDNTCTYTIQLGINGMATSGNWSYDSTGTGNILSRNTGTTRANRNSAGVGFGFTSRTDVNMDNSPYLTSGWVQSSDSVQTKYRHATLTALSMDAGGIPATDEGPLWLEFSNPSGAAVDAFIETGPSFPRAFTSPSGIGSRYNFPNLSGGSLTTALQNASPNSNTNTLRIGIHDSLGGDNWDYRDRTYTIKNDVGQANPTFSNFTYLDTDANSYGTVAITGSNQVLIQGKSTVQATVSVANKATPNKGATMSTYLFSIGSYSQSLPWSNTVDVVEDIGAVADVSGDQTLSVRATDSRGNSTAVTKNVTILEYFSPGFYANLDVKYSNDFDVSDGLTVTLFNTTVIGSIAPMTLSGTDKNAVTPTTGIQYDIAKDTGSFTGTWTNIPFTQEAGTGYVNVDGAALATSIETRMNSLTADNTVRWYILFKITDKLETQYFTVSIDVGRPFFRIGADGRLYYKEIEFFDTFSGKADLYYPSLQAYSVVGANWTRGGGNGFIGGWTFIVNSDVIFGGPNLGSNGDVADMDVYMPAGIYQFVFYFLAGNNTPKVDVRVNGSLIISGFDTYQATNYGEKIATSGSIGVLDGATYNITYTVNGRNAANTTNYMLGVFGVKCQRIGDL